MNDIDDLELETTETEEEAEPVEQTIATIDSVESGGVKLIFDGEEASDGKVYKTNAMQIFKSGDRVKLSKDSGTYLVDYSIGDPGSRSALPTGGTQGQFLRKSSNSNYAVEWYTLSISGTLPKGGTQGQFLRKSNSADYAAAWATISGLLPSGGTDGQILKKSGNADYSVTWGTLSVSGTLPKGGTQGQVLTKSNYTDYAASWETPAVSGNSTYIGFFGATANTRKQTVSKCSTSGTLANAITTINNLLTALNSYGLIQSL